jgi:hypothetical protein
MAKAVGPPDPEPMFAEMFRTRVLRDPAGSPNELADFRRELAAECDREGPTMATLAHMIRQGQTGDPAFPELAIGLPATLRYKIDMMHFWTWVVGS